MIKFLDKNLTRAINKNIIDDDIVMCSIIKISLLTGMRIGKDEHFKKYNTVGLSTIQKKHITHVSDIKIIFNFIGKKKVQYEYDVEDKAIVFVINKLYNKLKNDDEFLFKYSNNKKINYTDVNNYIKEILNTDNISNKDLRTTLANVVFIEQFIKNIPPGTTRLSDKDLNKIIKNIVKLTASVLQNTAAVSKKSYIFSIINEYIQNLNNKSKLDTIKDILPLDLLRKIIK